MAEKNQNDSFGKETEEIVISVGGSLIAPEDIDTDFLRDFVELVKSEVTAGRRFVLIAGGGKTCRRYQAAARRLGVSSAESIDWVGIYSTRMNGELLRAAFGELPEDLRKTLEMLNTIN